MAKLAQHKLVIEISGEQVIGHYTLERQGRWDRLTVWYRSQTSTDSKIAHEAEPGSTEVIAQELLRKLVVGEAG